MRKYINVNLRDEELIKTIKDGAAEGKQYITVVVIRKGERKYWKDTLAQKRLDELLLNKKKNWR